MSYSPSDPAGLSSHRVGAQLAAARTAQGLDLAEIAQRTRVPARHLEAIEGGRYEGLPATPYAVGFVRSYARLLGLDAEGLAREFRAELSREPAGERYVPDSFEPADPARVPPRLLVGVTLAIALVFALVYLAWRGGVFGDDDADARARLAAAPDPAPVTAVAPAAAPAPVPAGGAVVITAIEPVWLRVYEANRGPRLLERQLAAGESWTVPVTAIAPQILTGRPQAIRVSVGGRVIPPLGAPERTISDVSLKPADLLARLAPAPGAPLAAAPNPLATPDAVPPAFRDATAPGNASGL